MNKPTRIVRACLALFFITSFPGVFLQAQESKEISKPLDFSRFPSRFDSRKPLVPDQKLLLRFNAEVDADRIPDHFVFQNEPDKETEITQIPVKAQRPTLADIRSFGTSLVPKELAEEKQASFLNRFVLIEPSQSLTTGNKWLLQVKQGLSNFANTYHLKKDYRTTIGYLNAFAISSISPVNPYDVDMTIYIGHNKYQLDKSFDTEKLSQFVSVSPAPEDLAIEIETYGMRLKGKFEYDSNYEVTIQPGLIGNDTIALTKEVKKTVIFSPNRGFVRLPLFSETQNASGHRSFDVESANLETIRTRIKALKGDNLIFALKGYADGYEGHGGDRTIPFSLVPGKTIFDQTKEPAKEVDLTEKFTQSWSDIDTTSNFGAYFVNVGGTSRTDGTTFGTHALVQVTDIGMAWKQTKEETLIYAFSIKNGSPKNNMTIRLVTDEGGEIATATTNAEGIAKFAENTYKDSELWLDATLDKDRHVMPFSKNLERIGLWSFDIPYRYNGVTEGERRTLLFTDRDVYKPGETVYLKCISRTINSDNLLPATSCKAELTITDHRDKKLVSKEITLSENGTFHDQITLPENGLGYHSIKIDFNDPDSDGDREWDRISYHSFNVAEYRVNTFEVNLEAKDVVAKDNVTVPLSARYYMGKPLSRAKVNWNAYSRNQYLHPDGFDEFSFGDRDLNSDGNSKNEEIRLSRGGEANIDLEIPINPESPAPRRVSVRAEVTDINQQTISGHTSFTVHSSDFYIGLRRPEGIHRAGDSVPFSIVNIDTGGKVYSDPVKTNITVEKEIWTTVKVKGSDGKITHRNEKQHDLKHQETVEFTCLVDEATSLPRAQSHSITFEEAGDYVITLESKDNNGRKVLTRQNFRVIGAEEPAWAWNDVVAIDVIPDRKSYKIGDTAKLLVRSPVFGKALVTTERGDVKTTKTIEISEHETVIDIPVEPGAAPNIFASVFLVRGSDQSPHKHPTADYRLGFCRLDVEDPGIDLNITLETGNEKYYIPGQPVEVAALVTGENGNGIAGAEVTFYAVDEGILSLTGYNTPDPGKVFNETFPLSVMMGQSLSDLLPENPLERDFGNKGFVIGGGGMADDMTGNLKKVRKDFKAVAFWKPDLVTDENGKVTHTFTAPDNLTRFRLIAVVAKQNRFGSADAPVVINKPLIIEPALPSFSNLSDQIDLTAVLHNNTEENQKIRVSVTLDDHAVFVQELGEILPTNLSTLPADAKQRTVEISIDPGDTRALHFPTAMTKTGDAKWKWKVDSLTAPGLVDATESTIPVGFPLPLLKSSKELTTSEQTEIDNILSEVDPLLLDGIGEINITVSNSRMIEATDALDYLLEYPYGCVEQTTSSTIPWLSTGNMRKVLPSLDIADAEINKAIKKGTTRLLSMQTRDGGLSYWPGERESILWGSAYGGLALAIADKSGVDLPKDSLDDLWKYLSVKLRNSAKLTKPYELSQRCLAAYTLAVAGKPEPAYLDLLYSKRENLPREARSLLAMAIMESNQDPAVPDQRVEKLLTAAPGDAVSEASWYRKPYLKATELMAWSQFRSGSEKTDELLSELIDLRRGSRGWGSTYSNAWPLMALAAHTENSSASQSQNKVTVQFGGRTETVAFDGTPGTRTLAFPFEGDLTKQLMNLKVQNPGKIYTQIKVATQPKLLPLGAENKGFGISRTYQKVDMEGNLHPAENLMVGDLVLVRLDVDMPEGKLDYLAIDDPLPSILEAINPNFKTQDTLSVKRTKKKDEKIHYLYTNHRELRKDRTLFFANYVHRKGVQRVQYLTRVIAPGDSIAPPSKVEAMYDPDRYGLSDTRTLSARRFNPGTNPEVALR